MPKRVSLLTLSGSCVLQRMNCQDPEGNRWGPYQLFTINTPRDVNQWGDYPGPQASFTGPFAIPLYLPKVERIAIVADNIIGKTTLGYFIMNAKEDSPVPQIFDIYERLNEALRSAGIAPQRLADPSEIESALPPQTIRPWAYENMNALWGRSDNWWQGLIVESGYLVAIVAGSLMPWRKSAKGRLVSLATVCLFVVSLACWVNFKANVQILGSGPDAFVGQLFLPPTYVIAALWGIGIRRLFVDLSQRKSGNT